MIFYKLQLLILTSADDDLDLNIKIVGHLKVIIVLDYECDKEKDDF